MQQDNESNDSVLIVINYPNDKSALGIRSNVKVDWSENIKQRQANYNNKIKPNFTYRSDPEELEEGVGENGENERRRGNFFDRAGSVIGLNKIENSFVIFSVIDVFFTIIFFKGKFCKLS